MNRMTLVPDKLMGPHVDQGARDAIDDLGLVLTAGQVAGLDTYLMEVVR